MTTQNLDQFLADFIPDGETVEVDGNQLQKYIQGLIKENRALTQKNKILVSNLEFLQSEVSKPKRKVDLYA